VIDFPVNDLAFTRLHSFIFNSTTEYK